MIFKGLQRITKDLAMIGNASNTPGILICIVCGVIDATCFVALGGTFAGLMTGNLILMGVSLGGVNSGVAAAVFLYPLGGYAIGALLAGLWFKCRAAEQARQYGLWLGWGVLALATVLTWLTPITVSSVSGWLVVALAALYMGFQSAVLYLSKRVTITTNVMTSTLTGFLADYPLQMTNKTVSWNKLFALLGFLLGVITGAWLVPAGIHFSFSLSLVLATLAIAGLSGQPEANTKAPAK
jgi:uncharacterized membrane protein YoaK (UPF0700 family)